MGLCGSGEGFATRDSDWTVIGHGLPAGSSKTASCTAQIGCSDLHPVALPCRLVCPVEEVFVVALN
jgi:hypothetical protein